MSWGSGSRMQTLPSTSMGQVGGVEMRGWGPFLWTQTPWDELDGDQELRCHPVPPQKPESSCEWSEQEGPLLEAQALLSCLVLCERCRLSPKITGPLGPPPAAIPGCDLLPLPLALASSLMGVSGWNRTAQLQHPGEARLESRCSVPPSPSTVKNLLPWSLASKWPSMRQPQLRRQPGTHTEGERSQPTRC